VNECDCLSLLICLVCSRSVAYLETRPLSLPGKTQHRQPRRADESRLPRVVNCVAGKKAQFEHRENYSQLLARGRCCHRLCIKARYLVHAAGQWRSTSAPGGHLVTGSSLTLMVHVLFK